MAASWRLATANDIPALVRVAEAVHPSLPESGPVFAERAALFPEGCLVLVDDNEICGYAISHPIRRNQPPALDSLLGEIPADDADAVYYIHDVAILPAFRGGGLAAECVDRLLRVAERFPMTCLISVYDTGKFWGRFGFVAGPVDEVLSEKLREYGEDAVYLLRQNVEKDAEK